MSHIGEYTATNATLESALLPSSEAAREYMDPVHDDSWLRHAEFVKMNSLMETEQAAAVKEEILRDYQASKKASEPDPVLEGMIYQEKFMKEYKQSSSIQDKVKALSYKEQIMQKFRENARQPAIME